MGDLFTTRFVDCIFNEDHFLALGRDNKFITDDREINWNDKSRLVAQGFTQRPGIDFNETYSPVMNGITFQYLISLTTQKRVSLQLMDVVTAYLYGSLDLDIYMKVPDVISIPNANVGCNIYYVKLNKSLYGLKQSGRMWYNRLNEFLLNKGYSNNDDCSCVFIRKSSIGFCIISMYVDDLNIIGTEFDINEVRDHLKTEFEMNELGKTNFCLGLQLEHLPTRIFVHQSAYIQKVLEKFNMDKAYPFKTPMVARALKRILIYFGHVKREKRCWVLNTHT
jgi:hypothetical protein